MKGINLVIVMIILGLLIASETEAVYWHNLWVRASTALASHGITNPIGEAANTKGQQNNSQGIIGIYGSLVLSGIGLLILIAQAQTFSRQAGAAEDQRDLMRGQLDATKIAAEAAKSSADIAERALVSAQRAFVFVNMVIPTRGAGGGAGHYWDFSPNWANCGTTPARYALFHTSVRDGEVSDGFDYPNIPDAGESMDTSPISVGPGVSVGGNPRRISVNELSRAFRGETKFFLYGWVEYNDVFPNTPRHRTEFCVEITPIIDPSSMLVADGRNPFIFRNIGPHNGSEDECYRNPTPYVRQPHYTPSSP